MVNHIQLDSPVHLVERVLHGCTLLGCADGELLDRFPVARRVSRVSLRFLFRFGGAPDCDQLQDFKQDAFGMIMAFMLSVSCVTGELRGVLVRSRVVASIHYGMSSWVSAL